MTIPGANQMNWKNLVALDYPDIEYGSVTLGCHYGNFGEARKEVAEATGQKDYNFKGESILFKAQGVLNAEGTKITTWGLSNKLEEWVWMDEDMIKEMKEDRDPYEAPRFGYKSYYCYARIKAHLILSFVI